MQVRKYDEKDNLVFAYVLNAGLHKSAEYNVVYDEESKILHIYDEFLHHDTSIINNISIKNDVLESLGYSDGFLQSFINKIGRKVENSSVRMIVYILDVVWEVTADGEFVAVKDKSLLYKPFYDKVQDYSRRNQ